LAKSALSDYARGALQPTASILDRMPTVAHLAACLASVSNIASPKSTMPFYYKLLLNNSGGRI
jgi:hypothetical protein